MTDKLDIAPKSTAIIAIDFQHDIVGADGAFAPLFHTEAKRAGIIASAARLLGDARAAGVKIAYSTATFQPGYPELVANIPVLSRVAELQCLVDGTAGAAIVEAVAPHDNDIVLTHPRVSCFHGTQLDVVLRAAGIDTVVLTGIATNLAVESTARSAADLGYRTLVVSDACSTTSESAHNASLESLMMLAEIVPTDGLLAALTTFPQRGDSHGGVFASDSPTIRT
jgi:nicotinamidase-related amidase